MNLPIDLIERAPQDLEVSFSAKGGYRVLGWLEKLDESASIRVGFDRGSVRVDLNSTNCRDLAAFLLVAADELEARNA